MAPVKIRFREVQEPVVNWKDAFVKLLKHFEATRPGLLLWIATEQAIPAVVALDKDRFRRSKVQIGDIYVNTHASAASLREWCRRIARIALIENHDFEFITDDNV